MTVAANEIFSKQAPLSYSKPRLSFTLQNKTRINGCILQPREVKNNNKMKSYGLSLDASFTFRHLSMSPAAILLNEQQECY